jgi:hypothetical protein
MIEPPVPGRPPTSGCARIAGITPEWAVYREDRTERAIDRPHFFGVNMSKRARKRRSRKGNAANHGRKPNA